jgi:hypothetical protein
MVSEQKVSHEVIKRGFDVYGPVCGAGKVDLITYFNGVKSHIQIKSVRTSICGTPTVTVSALKYESNIIDAFVIHDAVRERFYIIPWRDMPRKNRISLTSAYDKYIDAWSLLYERKDNGLENNATDNTAPTRRTSRLAVESHDEKPIPKAPSRRRQSRRSDKRSSDRSQRSTG